MCNLQRAKDVNEDHDPNSDLKLEADVREAQNSSDEQHCERLVEKEGERVLEQDGEMSVGEGHDGARQAR